jgi:hypothetical protein
MLSKSHDCNLYEEVVFTLLTIKIKININVSTSCRQILVMRIGRNVTSKINLK